jgi:hypothetical protein
MHLHAYISEDQWIRRVSSRVRSWERSRVGVGSREEVDGSRRKEFGEKSAAFVDEGNLLT